MAKITDHMMEFEVSRALGSKGMSISPAGWPKQIGDIPGFEGGDIVAAANEKIEWFIWRPIDGDKWIAVGFANRHFGGILSMPTVFVKKSGLLKDLPDDI